MYNNICKYIIKVRDSLFKEITLKDRDTYLKYYDADMYPHSQYSFTIIYSWRNYLNARFDIIDDHFCIINRPSEKSVFSSFPIGKKDPNSAIDFLLGEMGQRGRIFNVTPQMYEKIENPERFIINDARYNFDYVYETSKLISLSGKKLHSKKNHLNKFLSLYPNYYYEPVDKSNLKACMSLADMWFENKYEDLNIRDAKAEYSSITDILNNMKELNCEGLILFSDGKPIAFSVGERINHETAIIHIEKADTSYEGSFAMINNLMCKTLFSDTIYINREEDMGIENIRKAKLSYRPHHFVEVMNLSLK